MKNIGACLASAWCGQGSDWKGLIKFERQITIRVSFIQRGGYTEIFLAPLLPYKFYYCNVIVQNFVNIYKTLAGALMLACTLCTHLHFPPSENILYETLSTMVTTLYTVQVFISLSLWFTKI